MYFIGKLSVKVLLFIGLFLTFTATSNAQECPQGLVCISQEAANKAAENKRELDATKEKVGVLENALAEKDKNDAELRAALKRTELALAEKTGQLIKAEANEVRMAAMVDFLLKHGRKKCYGLCVQF